MKFHLGLRHVSIILREHPFFEVSFRYRFALRSDFNSATTSLVEIIPSASAVAGIFEMNNDIAIATNVLKPLGILISITPLK